MKKLSKTFVANNTVFADYYGQKKYFFDFQGVEIEACKGGNIVLKTNAYEETGELINNKNEFVKECLFMLNSLFKRCENVVQFNVKCDKKTAGVLAYANEIDVQEGIVQAANESFDHTKEIQEKLNKKFRKGGFLLKTYKGLLIKSGFIKIEQQTANTYLQFNRL